jgi:uncharacterized protein (TIGR00369 family)
MNPIMLTSLIGLVTLHACNRHEGSSMPGDKNALIDLAQAWASVPYHRWLGPIVDRADTASGHVRIRLPVRDEFGREQAKPDVHGGIIAALIDIAGHAAVQITVGHAVPTVDLRVDYLRPARAKTLYADATILKAGRTIATVDIRVTDEFDKLLAAGRTAFLISGA